METTYELIKVIVRNCEEMEDSLSSDYHKERYKLHCFDLIRELVHGNVEEVKEKIV